MVHKLVNLLKPLVNVPEQKLPYRSSSSNLTIVLVLEDPLKFLSFFHHNGVAAKAGIDEGVCVCD